MKLLKTNQSFLFLMMGRSISLLGDRFYNVALMWTLVTRTGSALTVGLGAVCMTLPSLLVSPFSGVWADRFNKKALLILADIFSGGVMIILAILVRFPDLPMALIYSCLILESAFSALFSPAYSSSLPLIVKKENLQKANSINQLIAQISNIGAPALAGLLIVLLSPSILFFVNGLSFFFSMLMTTFIVIPMLKGEGRASQSFIQSFKEGIFYTLQTKKLLFLILVGGFIINFFLAPLNVYMALACQHVLHIGSKGLGVMDALISIGALGGSFLLLKLPTKFQIRLAVIGLILEGVALMVPGFHMAIWSFALFAALLGVGTCLAGVGIGTAFQLIIDEDKMGRVMSVGSMFAACTIPLGTLVGTLVTNLWSIHEIMLVSGVLVGLSGLSLVIPFKEEFTIKTGIHMRN